MVCINNVVISGNVSSISSGKTSTDTEAHSMVVCVDIPKFKSVIIRVNSYGDLAKMCEQRVKRGMYLVVSGKLTTRKTVSGDDTIEIRAHQILFPSEEHSQDGVEFGSNEEE